MVRNLNNVYALDSELYRDLESEAIRQYGYEVYYLPKSEQITDELHGEDPLSSFNKSFFMIMDIKTLDAFEGGESFINEIGRGFLKHINLIIETRDFKQYTGDELLMPKPRDLIKVSKIYGMENKASKIIKYVDEKQDFKDFPSREDYNELLKDYMV